MKGILKALLLALITLAASCGYTFAQVDRSSNKQFMGSVMVGTDTTALLTQSSSAWLQIGRDSTNKGFLLPRVGDTSDITSPVYGLIVFSHADSAFYIYKDHWVPVGSSRDLAAYVRKDDSGKVYITPSYVSSHTPTLQQVTAAGDSTIVSSITVNAASGQQPVTIGSVTGMAGVLINLNHRSGGWVKEFEISQPSPDLTLNRGVTYGGYGNDSLINYGFWIATNDSLKNSFSSTAGMRLYPNGSLYYGTPPANTSAATKFFTLGSDGHTIGTRTASQVLSDIGAASSADVSLLSADNTFTGANSFAEVPRITSSTAGHNAIYFSDASGGTGSSPTYNVIGFNGTSFYFTPVNKTNAAQFSATGLTARRTYTLPDNSGNIWTSGGDDSTSGHIHVAGEAWFGGIAGFGGTPASPYATINGLGQVAAQTLSIGSTFAVDNSGNVTTAATTATQYKLSALNTAPSSATATGTTGEIRITSDYIYVCIATNTWVRAALSTW